MTAPVEDTPSAIKSLGAAQLGQVPVIVPGSILVRAPVPTTAPPGSIIS